MDDVATARLRADLLSLRRWAIFAGMVSTIAVIFGGLLLARWWTEREVEARAGHWSAGHDSATLDGIRSDLAALRAEVKREGEISAEARGAINARVDDLRSRVDQKLDETSRSLAVLGSKYEWANQQLIGLGVEARWGGLPKTGVGSTAPKEDPLP